jgi:hypothetical protein
LAFGVPRIQVIGMRLRTVWKGVPHLAVIVENEPLALPRPLQQQVDDHWNELLATGAGFFRGPVLSAKEVHSMPASVVIEAVMTDYAHYLYSRLLPEASPYRVRVIFAAACLITTDQILLAGVMSPNTSRPGWIQAVGGSPAWEDIDGRYFNPVISACRETEEEVGMAVSPQNCRVMGFTQDEMGRIAVAVHMPVKHTARDIIPRIRGYLETQKEPELQDVLGIPLGPLGLKMLDSQTRPVVRYLKAIVQGLYAGG